MSTVNLSDEVVALLGNFSFQNVRLDPDLSPSETQQALSKLVGQWEHTRHQTIEQHSFFRDELSLLFRTIKDIDRSTALGLS